MQRLIDYAMQFVGGPYKWGGDDPMAGFDCSGFIQELLASVGEDPPGDQTAHSLYRYFKRYGTIRTSTAPYPGNLAFFGSENQVGHVSMCIDSHRIIEAGGGGRNVKTIEDAKKYNAYIRVRPIDLRSDLVAVIGPNYQFMNWS